jgi:predicted transcriptional regulator
VSEATVSPLINDPRILRLTSEISAAYFANNVTPPDQVATVILGIRAALNGLNPQQEEPVPRPEPAVPVRRSVTPDHLICLEDGKKLKMLKRYLKARYDMTPDDYRARWNLPVDYPMVAPNYARLRSEFARKMGLGKKDTAER